MNKEKVTEEIKDLIIGTKALFLQKEYLSSLTGDINIYPSEIDILTNGICKILKKQKEIKPGEFQICQKEIKTMVKYILYDEKKEACNIDHLEGFIELLSLWFTHFHNKIKPIDKSIKTKDLTIDT